MFRGKNVRFRGCSPLIWNVITIAYPIQVGCKKDSVWHMTCLHFILACICMYVYICIHNITLYCCVCVCWLLICPIPYDQTQFLKNIITLCEEAGRASDAGRPRWSWSDFLPSTAWLETHKSARPRSIAELETATKSDMPGMVDMNWSLKPTKIVAPWPWIILEHFGFQKPGWDGVAGGCPRCLFKDLEWCCRRCLAGGCRWRMAAVIS